MVLIVAALREELGIALDLCSTKSRIGIRGLRAWIGLRCGKKISFLKTGVGPIRSERSLSLYLRSERISQILAVGYAGALDPTLRVGDLVMARQASLLDSSGAALQNLGLNGTWMLEGIRGIHERSLQAGLSLHQGDVLTSSYIIGEPKQKLLLYQKFHASIIDMETAALARVATEAAVSLACVRAVSDEARDEFLAPFSYDPSASRVSQAAKALFSGNWFQRYDQWRDRAAVARRSLKQFLQWYLDSNCQESTVNGRPHR